MLRLLWVIPSSVWSCRQEHAGEKERSDSQPRPRPPSQKAADVTEEKRRRERNTISPTPPSLIWENNTQPPVGEGQLLSLSPRSRSRAKSRQTRWHIDLLLREETTVWNSCCTLHGLIQYLDSSWATISASVCFHESVDSIGLFWRPRTTDAAPVFAPARTEWPLSIPGIAGQHCRPPAAGREAALWEVLEGDFQGCGHPETGERHRCQHHRPQEGDQVSSLLSNRSQRTNASCVFLPSIEMCLLSSCFSESCQRLSSFCFLSKQLSIATHACLYKTSPSGWGVIAKKDRGVCLSTVFYIFWCQNYKTHLLCHIQLYIQLVSLCAHARAIAWKTFSSQRF